MLGLREQLVGYSVGFAAAVGAVAVAHSAVLRRDAAVEALRDRGRLSLSLLAERLEGAIPKGTAHLTMALARARLDPDVSQALLLDPTGAVVSDGQAGEEDAQPSPEFRMVVDEAMAEGGPVMGEVAGRLILAEPLRDGAGQLLGVAYVEMTGRKVAEQLGSELRAQVTVVVVLTGAGLVMGIMVMGDVTHAIRRVREAVEAMSRGRLEARVPVSGPPDLETIASQLNAIAERTSAATSYKTFVNNMLQSMADCLIVVDIDATIRAVNQATLDLLGYTEEQLLGQPVSLVCIENGYELSMTRMQQLLGSRSRKDHEVSFRCFDGRMVPISLSGSPIRDNEERLVGYVCLGTDITERKNAETERTSLNKQLVDASRQAGMAEVATGVLHNVGNVLNSVTVSATLATDLLKRSRLDRLDKAVALLKEHEGNLGEFLSRDEKGKLLPGYLSQLGAHLASEQEKVIEELTALTKNIGHIKEIISMQQSFSKKSGVIEAASASELIEDAIQMNAEALTKHDVRVVRSYADTGRIKTDQHKVLQILVNLISNACDAMAESKREHKVLRVRLVREEQQDWLRIEVCDNGVGISQKHQTKVFTHGFTTKKKGHGFGLHSAALAAKELGGSLTVSSEGEGKGATFALRLPSEAAPAKEPKEAGGSGEAAVEAKGVAA
jgi:PAS domain S-box-containing protein